MATFHCEQTFTILPDRFVFAGQVRAGVIDAGMSVNVPLNGSVAIRCEVVEVEVINAVDSTKIGLVVRVTDNEELEFMRALNVYDEFLEVE